MLLVDTTIQIEGEANHTHPRASTHSELARKFGRASVENGGRRGRRREPIHTWDEIKTYSHLKELNSGFTLSQFHLSLVKYDQFCISSLHLQFAMLDVEDHNFFMHNEWNSSTFIHIGYAISLFW
jgi:hypothetical protein